MKDLKEFYGFNKKNIMNNIHSHSQGKYEHSHAHAYATIKHDHFLRAVCNRDECKDYPTHNIHQKTKRR